MAIPASAPNKTSSAAWEYHARIVTFSLSTAPPTGASRPSGTAPPMGTSGIRSSPARERSVELSWAASSAANQATWAAGGRLGSLAGMIRDKAPREGTAGRAASGVTDTLSATEPSLVQLLTCIVNDARGLLRHELTLATDEIREDLRKTKRAMLSLNIGIVVKEVFTGWLDQLTHMQVTWAGRASGRQEEVRSCDAGGSG
jgi:hypothetical protein